MASSASSSSTSSSSSSSTSSMDPTKFEIKKEIGSGGTSTVYLAIYKPTKKKYAIKSIEKMHMGDREWKNLQREASIMKSLQHRNVLQLYHIFESDQHYHFVLEYMDGGELFQHIVDRGSFSEQDARKTISQILQGVAYLHEKKIAHRDLKPENLLCSTDGRVVISDFGLSKFFGRGELLKTRCGTPGYVAPEVVQGVVPYTTAVDMWTIGVITYILVSGTTPFYGDDEQVFNQILSCKYDFPAENFATVSALAKDFIKNLIKAKPKDRLTATQCLAHPWIQAPLSSLGNSNVDLRASVEQYYEDKMKL